MSSQNGAMIGGEDRKVKLVIKAVVYDLPNESTPFVFTCIGRCVMHNINIIAAEIK